MLLELFIYSNFYATLGDKLDIYALNLSVIDPLTSEFANYADTLDEMAPPADECSMVCIGLSFGPLSASTFEERTLTNGNDPLRTFCLSISCNLGCYLD